MLLGSWVTGHGAGLAYTDFPLMDGALVPAVRRQRAGGAPRTSGHEPRGRRPGRLDGRRDVALDRCAARAPARAWMIVLVVVQIALGGLNVVSRLSAFFVVPHLAVGAALWGASVWLLLTDPPAAAIGARALGVRRAATEIRADRHVLRAYVALMKPRIIELLLVTTVPTMVLAERGVPSLWLDGGRHRRWDPGGRGSERDQHVRRPRHRRRHASHAPPAAAAPRGRTAQRALVRDRSERRRRSPGSP